MAKEVGFLHGPFTFVRGDRKVLVLKTLKDFVENRDMFFPTVGKDADVVDVDLDVIAKVSEDFFHELLTEVWGLLNSHRETTIAKFAKRRSDNAKIAGKLVEFESVKTHRDVKFCEILVAFASSKNIFDPWKGINAAIHLRIKRTKVRDHSDSSILFRNGEMRSGPLSGTNSFENADIDKPKQFLFKGVMDIARDRIMTMMCRFGIGHEIEMQLFVRIGTQDAIKDAPAFQPHTKKILLL